MRVRAPAPRTAFQVVRGQEGPIESIAGERHAWRFRPHFHAGDEVVRMLAGRARLKLPAGCRMVAAGDTVTVPSGTVHCFEPVDDHGWAFVSQFVAKPAPSPATDGGGTLGEQARALLVRRSSLRTGVEGVAQACGVSAGHLARAFRRETGTGLHNFHILLALHRAKALLRMQMPIVEAALAAGFYDQAHLNREFVKTFGMTPAAFRLGWAATH
ncbi:AraC family transcriptional regulator [Frateuria soli]|uniref:AraC family transcriptional regulator n=1 Tax=Frateuria soli TaxID=1542730 RepID=UPI001E569464|nr:AraC family transcriptional regulator [Frateuria soli]UGB39068.1 AraC family transcriptional regulator [Frateuria soli]